MRRSKNDLLYLLAIVGLVEIAIGEIFKDELRLNGLLVYWNIVGFLFFVIFLLVLIFKK